MDALDAAAATLADGIDAALPGWVVRSVALIVEACTGAPPPADVQRAAEEAGRRAGAVIGPRVRALLAADVDEQRTTPLAIVREAVRYPTAVLRAAGVPPVERDRFAQEAFPADDYGLTPATFADIDPALADAGLAWGAAKAWTHRRRHGGVG